MKFKKINLIMFLVAMITTFSITSFDFKDYSLDNNTKEYIGFIIAFLLFIFYIVTKKKQ